MDFSVFRLPFYIVKTSCRLPADRAGCPTCLGCNLCQAPTAAGNPTQPPTRHRLQALQRFPTSGSLKNKNRLRSRQTVFCRMDWVSGCPALCGFQVIQAGDGGVIMLIGAAASWYCRLMASIAGFLNPRQPENGQSRFQAAFLWLGANVISLCPRVLSRSNRRLR